MNSTERKALILVCRELDKFRDLTSFGFREKLAVHRISFDRPAEWDVELLAKALDKARGS